MRRMFSVGTILLCSILALAGATGASVDETKLDQTARQRVIDAVVADLKKYYVYPGVAAQMQEALLAHEKNGDDNAVTDGTPWPIC